MRTMALIAVAAAQLCAQSMFRGDAAHTGAYAGPGPREFRGVRWKFATGGRIVGSPAVAGGIVYVGSDDNNVYAVDAATGRERWKFVTGGPVPSTPAVADGVVYFASYDGKFYAVEADSGRLRWRFATGGERRFEAKGIHGFQPKNQTIADPFDVFLSSPVVARGVVYFGSGDGNVYALDAESGALRWKFATGDVVHASPAFADGTVFVGSFDSWFYAIDAASGKEKWKFHGGEDALMHNQVGFQSSPAVAGGVVYTGCRDSNVYALDAATGKELWRFNNNMSWVNASPAVAGGRVYFATSDSSLFHAADAKTGKPVYQQSTGAYVFGSPAVVGDVVLVGVLNGTLEARDAASGALLWSYQTDLSRQNAGWVLTSERKLNGPMLAQSSWREDPLVAVDRQFRIGAFFASPVAANGVVYVGATDGYLYAM